MSSFSLSGGVEVMGYISPTDTNDTYPVIDPLYGIDGFRNVNLITDLNSIPEPRRRAGMVVGVSGGTTYYKLNSSPWNYTISDWSLFNTGGGSASGDYLPLSGGTVTGNTVFTLGLSANTISATTYQNLPPSTDYYVTGGTYNYTGGTVTLRRNDGNDVSITGFNYNDTWTVELINALSVDFYAPYNLSISSVTNILGSPTITLYDDNVLYNLGDAVGIGSKITVVASVTGVTNLNLIRT
jgi:hypothetical protein